MIVSDSPKFICFQPWKVASTTLFARLSKYDSGRYPQDRYFNEHLGQWTSKHITLDKFMGLPESSEPYYCFCFVRNPYDRIYSGFRQRQHRLTTDHDYFLSLPRHAHELRAIERGFVAYLKLVEESYGENDKSIIRALHEHVYYRGEPMLDYVGYIETFEECFAQVCGEIGIDNVGQINANVRYAHDTLFNASSTVAARYHYIKEYDADAIQIVNDVFARDFGLLGYRMLDPGLVGEDHSRLTEMSPFTDEVGEASGGAKKARREASSIRH